MSGYCWSGDDGVRRRDILAAIISKVAGPWNVHKKQWFGRAFPKT